MSHGDLELGYGSVRLRIRWSTNRTRLAVLADPEVQAGFIDRALKAVAPIGSTVLPAEVVSTKDGTEPLIAVVGRIAFPVPQEDDVRLAVTNAVSAALLRDLSPT